MNDITTTVVTSATRAWDTLVTAEQAVEKAVKAVAKPVVVYEARDAAQLVSRSWSTPPKVVTSGVAAGTGGLLATVSRVAIFAQAARDLATQGGGLVYKAKQLVGGEAHLTPDNLIGILVGAPLEKGPLPEVRLPSDPPVQEAAPAAPQAQPQNATSAAPPPSVVSTTSLSQKAPAPEGQPQAIKAPAAPAPPKMTTPGAEKHPSMRDPDAHKHHPIRDPGHHEKMVLTEHRPLSQRPVGWSTEVTNRSERQTYIVIDVNGHKRAIPLVAGETRTFDSETTLVADFEDPDIQVRYIPPPGSEADAPIPEAILDTGSGSLDPVQRPGWVSPSSDLVAQADQMEARRLAGQVMGGFQRKIQRSGYHGSNNPTLALADRMITNSGVSTDHVFPFTHDPNQANIDRLFREATSRQREALNRIFAGQLNGPILRTLSPGMLDQIRETRGDDTVELLLRRYETHELLTLTRFSWFLYGDSDGTIARLFLALVEEAGENTWDDSIFWAGVIDCLTAIGGGRQATYDISQWMQSSGVHNVAQTVLTLYQTLTMEGALTVLRGAPINIDDHRFAFTLVHLIGFLRQNGLHYIEHLIRRGENAAEIARWLNMLNNNLRAMDPNAYQKVLGWINNGQYQELDSFLDIYRVFFINEKIFIDPVVLLAIVRHPHEVAQLQTAFQANPGIVSHFLEKNYNNSQVLRNIPRVVAAHPVMTDLLQVLRGSSGN